MILSKKGFALPFSVFFALQSPIIGYGPHGAIIHYSATAESCVPLEPRSFVLADTGGHYREGTTEKLESGINPGDGAGILSAARTTRPLPLSGTAAFSYLPAGAGQPAGINRG